LFHFQSEAFEFSAGKLLWAGTENVECCYFVPILSNKSFKLFSYEINEIIIFILATWSFYFCILFSLVFFLEECYNKSKIEKYLKEEKFLFK